mgnify:CR=1 FL=1
MTSYELAKYNDFIEERMTVKYPSRNDYIIVYAYNKGKKVFEGTQTEWSEKYKNPEFAKAVVEKDKESKKDEYDKLVKEYNTQRNKAYQEWKEELFKYAEADINNKQHVKLYDKIYEDNHSCMSDVVYKFDEYMEILL